jgi:hypothetical protein
MSALQSSYITERLNNMIDLKLKEKFEAIFKDKRFFEPFSHEEVDREKQREIINVQLLKFLKEVSKIVPLKEAFNNIFIWCALCEPAVLHNDAIVIKMSVNFQLYHKSIVNLGSDMH